jgi:uncharacterized protein YabE (DUF348 family)
VVTLLLTTYFCLEKSVTIKADDRVIEQSTFKKTVGEVLEANNIKVSPHDQVIPGLETKVKENTVITVVRAFPVTVIADGQSKEIIGIPQKVKKLLQQAKVPVGEKDLVSANLDDLTYKGQVIKVTRVAEETIEITNPVPFTREYISDNNLEAGLTRTVSRGNPGQVRQLVKVTYHDGKEAKRETLLSELVRQPVNEVIARGTITSVSRGGLRLDFQRALIAEATAYTYSGRRTATGKNPAVGMISVDPAVIPMGSRLYVEGYGYATAADRGSSIKGNKIDVFLESKEACRQWGRRPVKVYVLK